MAIYYFHIHLLQKYELFFVSTNIFFLGSMVIFCFKKDDFIIYKLP